MFCVFYEYIALVISVFFSYAAVLVLLGLFLTDDGFYRTLLAGDCIL
jgi:hypothetical protein